MTDQERISKIEASLADLEKQLGTLKSELSTLKHTTQVKASASPEPTKSGHIDSPVNPTVGTTVSVAASIQETADASASVITTPETPKTAAAPTVTVSDTAVASKPVVTAAQTPNTKSVQTNTTTKKTASRFEENFGGKVMGILAAILVFVGLFLFGSMLYERLGDSARVAILFLVSFLLLGAGLFLERKRSNWFTTSLIGCGFGAIYISLFITTLYYELIEVEVLYCILMFWLIGIGLYVFRKQSYTVALLGQIGITFSVLFGCLGIESKAQFTFLSVYFTVFSLLYLWIVLWRFLPDTKTKPYSWIHLTAAGLNLLQLWCLALSYNSNFGDYSTFGGVNWTAGILLCFYCFLLPLFFLLRQRLFAKLPLLPWGSQTRTIDKETFSVYRTGVASAFIYAIYQFVAWITFNIIFGVFFDADVPRAIAVLLGLLLSFIIVEVFGTTGTEGRGSCIVSAVAVYYSLLVFELPNGLWILLAILFCVVNALIGIFGSECPIKSVLSRDACKWEYLCKQEKGRCFEKFTACAYFIVLYSSYDSGSPIGLLLLIALFGIVFLGGQLLFLYRLGREHRFTDGWKLELYLFGMFHILWTCAASLDLMEIDAIVEHGITLTVLVLCNSVAFYSNFRKKLTMPNVLHTGTTVMVRLIQTGLWFWGLALLHSGAISDHPVLCVWIVLLTMYLCGSGMREQYKTYQKKTGLGIYFGLRVTFYALTVLTAFDGIEGYLISCALLVLAVIAILVGFALRLAPLRIYGLCLAMFAVVKLLMIDVEHDNSMETVLCFLGAGLLCFAINFIYNYVKKKVADL